MRTTSGEQIRAWVQTLALIIAGVWGAYEFYYKEYYAPKSVPINITMELEPKQVDQPKAGGANGNSTFPLRIKVVAKNPSKRIIYLVNSVWWTYGLNVEARETDEKEFTESVVKALNGATGEYSERFTATIGSKELVAAGSLFKDTSVKPDEAITRVLIIYLPRKYDKLEIATKITTSGKDPKEKLEVIWDGPDHKTWRSIENGTSKEIDQKMFKNYRQEFELQDNEAKSDVSLPR